MGADFFFSLQKVQNIFVKLAISFQAENYTWCKNALKVAHKKTLQNFSDEIINKT